MLIKNDDLKNDVSRMQDASDSSRYGGYINDSMVLMGKISKILFEEGDSVNNEKTFEMAKKVVNALKQEVSSQAAVSPQLQR